MKETPATIRYELRIVRNCTIRIAHQDIKLEGNNDSGVISMIITQGHLLLSDTIVAVITDNIALMWLRSHILAGGQLSLGNDLAP